MERGWVGWVAENRLLVGAIALVTAIGLTIVAVAANNSDDDKVASKANVETGPGAPPTATSPETSVPGADAPVAPPVAGGAPARPAGGAPAAGAPAGTTPTALPGGVTLPPCRPKPGYKATGIDETSVTIGQIVTDVNALPQQLRPSKEGLEAYVRLVNAAGGVCGRQIKISYRNDNLNPATHDYQGMARQVFSFVANTSLLDGNDYQSEPPFNPRYTDNGKFVPDIGGLAFTYGRNQSEWHVGSVGAVSPVLVGGTHNKLMQDRQRAAGKPCTKGAIVYLNEPTGLSQDQARLDDASIRAPWGAGLGDGNTKFYVENLAQPVVVYEAEVQRMMDEGMNCVFPYMDMGSTVALVQAMVSKGVWPPDKCKLGPKCFRMVFANVATYDPKFIRDGGEGALFVTFYIPHVPFNETSAAPMRAYLETLKKYQPVATPSTFSIFGYTAGHLFVQALAACGAAPTRECVMGYAREKSDSTAGALIAHHERRRTRVRCGDCGTFQWKGSFDWKWRANCWALVQVQDRGGKRDFHRVAPNKELECGALRVGRGVPA